GGGTLYLTNANYPQYAGLSGAFVRVSGARVRLDDLSNVGSFIALTLDNGTLQYGGTNSSYSGGFATTGNGGALEVTSAVTSLTLTGLITGIGPLTKSGPGTLILNNTANAFYGGLIMTGGTLAVGNDAQLGVATVTVNPPATVLYTASTSTSRT